MHFSNLDEAVSTVLLQNISEDSYIPLHYLIREDNIFHTWNTDEPNLYELEKRSAVTRMEGKFYCDYNQHLYTNLNKAREYLGLPWVFPQSIRQGWGVGLGFD